MISVGMLKCVFPIGLIAFASACASPPHMVITGPSKEAPVEKRTETYEQYHSVSKHGLGVTKSQRQDHMDLADGKKIYYPGDLYHVVPRGSDTDYSMDLHDRYRSGQKVVTYLGAAAMVAGALVAGVGAAAAPEGEATTSVVVGGILIGGGLGIAFVGGGYLANKASVQRERAFASYNEDLAARLGICLSSDGQPVDCPPGEPPVAPASAPVEPSPPAMEPAKPPPASAEAGPVEAVVPPPSEEKPAVPAEKPASGAASAPEVQPAAAEQKKP